MNNEIPEKINKNDTLENIEIKNPKSRSKKSTFFKILFILINFLTIGIILSIEISKGDMIDLSSVSTVLSENIIWLIFAIGIFFIKFMADSLTYFFLIMNVTGEHRLKLSMKVALIGKYGDGITPLSTGGQPFQLFYLNKYNIELSKGAGLTLTKSAVRIIGFTLTMLFFFVFFSQEGNGVIKITAYLGLLINSTFPIIIILFSINRKWGESLTRFIIKKLHKYKFVKDYDKTLDYWTNKVDDMLKSIKYFSTHKVLFFTLLFLSVIEIITLASVPYFVYRSFGGDGNISFIFMLVSTMYVMSAALISPTPGTSGAAEASFYAIFESVITSGLLFYALFTWRFITFYSFIFGGIILIIFESIFKKKSDIDIHDMKKGRITNRQRKLFEKRNRKN